MFSRAQSHVSVSQSQSRLWPVRSISNVSVLPAAVSVVSADCAALQSKKVQS